MMSGSLGYETWSTVLVRGFRMLERISICTKVATRSTNRYKRPHVKEIAINDSFILESCVFELIRKRFRGRPSYVSLLELFHEVTLQTEIGQLLDLTSQPIDGTPDLQRFTPSRHAMIVKYKTAFYSFYLPVACGMILSGIDSRKRFKRKRFVVSWVVFSSSGRLLGLLR